MKTFRFALVFSLTLALGITLNTKIGPLPPAGKFFSPFHGFWQNAENEKIQIRPSISLEGLSDEVSIHFDEQVIPHIFAQSEKDLFFAQGYITAFHRLWQMEFQLLSAEGRLSEILGDVTIAYDRSMRRIGLKYGAKKSFKLIKDEEPEIYERIEAYSAGVNAYISSLNYSELPIEYKILDYKPEEWTTFKSFLLIANMQNMLSRDERDLEHTNALKKYGREIFDILYPERPDEVDPVIPIGTEFDFEPVAVKKPSNSPGPLAYIDPILPKSNPDNGSNSFVVNGKKTANGKVILTNEPDLSLNFPSIWYIAHLNAPGINVMGATLPGSPGVTIGFNDSIAWGNTNAKRDLVDWYQIKFQDTDRTSYQYNNKWVPTRKVIEEIKVRGQSTFYDTIIYTHHGPVVYDRNFKSERSKTLNLAMRWTAHDASKELKSMILVNKAENYEEFTDAFRDFSGPPQNYSFASVSGDIALRIHGKFPVKWKEQGKFLMDGNDIAMEWQAMMPYEHILQVKNPDRNFVSSANQHAADSTYPYYQYDYNFEDYRGRRINDRLRVMENITVKDMMKLQHDNFNYNASEALPMMLDSLDTTKLFGKSLEYYMLLSNWDYFNEADYSAPSLYDCWWKSLNSNLWEELDSSDIKLYRPDWFKTVSILKSNPAIPFYDNIYTQKKETSGDLIRDSFDQMVKKLQEFETENESISWYKYKNTTVQHLLRIMPFSQDQVKIGGNKSIVNAASAKHGPSWRMIVELGDGQVNAWGVFPGNQSGNPGNPAYGKMIEDWASGTYYPLLFQSDLSQNSDKIISNTSLQPR